MSEVSETSTSPVVWADNLSLHYGQRTVLENLSFTLQAGEWAYLTGRTGTGKTSLLRLLYADARPTTGSLRVGAYAIEKIQPSQVPHLRRQLGIVFQDFQLLPELDVAANLHFVMKATGWRDKAQMKARTEELLTLLGLEGRAHQYPHQLSGGEQQRVAIARALINKPLLLVADEPTGNLDPDVARIILQVLRQVHHAGTAVLMATHNYELIQQYPARVLELKEGELSEKEVV